MSKRVTVMLDDDVDKKIRLKQSKEIQNSMSSVSFSKVLNAILRKGLNLK